MSDDLADYARQLQVALTGIAGGGSELFIQHGGDFRADIPFCVARIQERHNDAHQLVCKEIRARKAAAATIEAQATRIAALEAALRLVDDDVRHNLRSDEIAPALVRPHAIRAVRAALSTTPAPAQGDV